MMQLAFKISVPPRLLMLMALLVTAAIIIG
jgi:hypothetical protein